MSFERVKKSNLCPICGRGDWCLITPDKSASICARVAEGSVKRCGDAGWLHILSKPSANRQPRRRAFTIRTKEKKRSSINWPELARRCERAMAPGDYQKASEMLGVSIESLKRLHMGRYGYANTFPMQNAEGQITGIRRRYYNGRKDCITGSITGLFIPDSLTGKGPLLCTEGNSDILAAIDLGFDAVGRPNCNSLVAMTATVCRGRDVVVVADNDPKSDGSNPGAEGAMKLAERLIFACPSVKVILPPVEYKDLRGWYRAGLIREELLTEIEKTEPIALELI